VGHHHQLFLPPISQDLSVRHSIRWALNQLAALTVREHCAGSTPRAEAPVAEPNHGVEGSSPSALTKEIHDSRKPAGEPRIRGHAG